MNAFASGSGIDFVLGFVSRCFLAIGKARGKAQLSSLALWQDRKPSDVWFLSMVLCYWYSDQLAAAEAAAMAAAFADSGISGLTSVLGFFRDRLTPFARTAYQARSEPDLDEAAVYFNAALEQIGTNTIATALQSAKIAEIGAALTAKYPLPADIEDAFVGKTQSRPNREVKQKPVAIGETIQAAEGKPTSRAIVKERQPPAPLESAKTPPSVPAKPAPNKPTRGERFDRADRDRAQSMPPVPKLAAEEVLVAHLYKQGWTPEQIETIRLGPKKGIA